MKILFLVLRASKGGHARSAECIAEEFARKRNEVLFAVGDRSPFTPRSIRYLKVKHGSEGSFFHPLVVKSLVKTIRAEGIEVVHAFDQYSGLIAFWISVITGVKVTLTICGGTQGVSLLYLPRIAVFSEELRKGYPEKERDNVSIIPNRIAVNWVNSDLSRNEVFQSVGLDPSRPTILVVCRIGRGKISQIKKSISLFKGIANELKELQLLIVGANQIGDIQDLQEMVDQTDGIALDTTRYVGDAWRLNSCVDIVWGVGRSLYEGMHFGKPVFLMADFSLAGVVNEERCSLFMRTNFSGRDQIELSLEEHIIEHKRVLKDCQYREDLVIHNLQWLKDNVDVSNVDELYQPLYKAVGSGWGLKLPLVAGVYSYLAAGGLKSRLKFRIKQSKVLKAN